MGRDRGKFNKRGGRGGRGTRIQATSADEIELRNSRVAQFDAIRAKRRAEAEDENGNEGGSDGEEELNEGMKRVEIAKGEGMSSEPRPMTRKEREEKEKERKAAEYRRRHELGLTEEYKRDMAKLAEVKKRREEAKQRAAEEKEENELEKELNEEVAASKKEEKKKKKKKEKEVIPKLDKISIKKMKPTQLKEALKVRGLDIQGNAKALTERLLTYEAGR